MYSMYCAHFPPQFSAIPLLPVIIPVGIDYDFYITENENSSVPGL